DLGAAHPGVPRHAEDAATALAVDPSDLQGVGTSADHLLATLLTGVGAEDRDEPTATDVATLDVQAGPPAGDHHPLLAVVQREGHVLVPGQQPDRGAVPLTAAGGDLDRFRQRLALRDRCRRLG